MVDGVDGIVRRCGQRKEVVRSKCSRHDGGRKSQRNINILEHVTGPTLHRIFEKNPKLCFLSQTLSIDNRTHSPKTIHKHHHQYFVALNIDPSFAVRFFLLPISLVHVAVVAFVHRVIWCRFEPAKLALQRPVCCVWTA